MGMLWTDRPKWERTTSETGPSGNRAQLGLLLAWRRFLDRLVSDGIQSDHAAIEMLDLLNEPHVRAAPCQAAWHRAATHAHYTHARVQHARTRRRTRCGPRRRHASVTAVGFAVAQCAAWVFRPLLDYATAAHAAARAAPARAAAAPTGAEDAEADGEVVPLPTHPQASPAPGGIPAAFFARLHELDGSAGGVTAGLKLPVRGRRGVEASLLLRQLYWEGMMLESHSTRMLAAGASL